MKIKFTKKRKIIVQKRNDILFPPQARSLQSPTSTYRVRRAPERVRGWVSWAWHSAPYRPRLCFCAPDWDWSDVCWPILIVLNSPLSHHVTGVIQRYHHRLEFFFGASQRVAHEQATARLPVGCFRCESLEENRSLWHRDDFPQQIAHQSFQLLQSDTEIC